MKRKSKNAPDHPGQGRYHAVPPWFSQPSPVSPHSR